MAAALKGAAAPVAELRRLKMMQAAADAARTA